MAPFCSLMLGSLPDGRVLQHDTHSWHTAAVGLNNSEVTNGCAQLCDTTDMQPHLFSLYRRAASALAGELGLGSHRRDCRCEGQGQQDSRW